PIHALSLHDALPISRGRWRLSQKKTCQQHLPSIQLDHKTLEIMKKSYLAILIYCSFLISCRTLNKQRSAQKYTNNSESQLTETRDRKSTRLNSSHVK